MGGTRDAHPQGVQIFQFHAVFGKFWQNRMLAAPWGVGAPSSGKSWIHHCTAQIVLTIKNYFACSGV